MWLLLVELCPGQRRFEGPQSNPITRCGKIALRVDQRGIFVEVMT